MPLGSYRGAAHFDFFYRAVRSLVIIKLGSDTSKAACEAVCILLQ